MRWISRFLCLISWVILPLMAWAQPLHAKKNPERGWWFYEDPIIFAKPSKSKPTTASILPSKPCQTPQTWRATCGFVVPESYTFEQQEYHALLEHFSMHANNLNAVQQFQQFNHWAVGQAVTAAYTWQYNNVQHPELDSSVFNPYSRFGNLFLSELKQTREQSFFHLLSESALLVYFSRSDCLACQRQVPIVQHFARKTEIPIWEASLDTQVLAGFKKTMRAPDTLAPAQVLQVNWVPALFLYLKPNGLGQSAKWIRLGTGLVSEATLKSRTLNFVQAYRHALIQGAKGQKTQNTQKTDKSGQTPDFTPLASHRLAVGVEAVP